MGGGVIRVHVCVHENACMYIHSDLQVCTVDLIYRHKKNEGCENRQQSLRWKLEITRS